MLGKKSCENEMKKLWNITINQYFEIIDLAKKNGKVPGNSMMEEFEIIAKKYNLNCIGETDKDIDILAGDLREENIKVLNIKEIERQNENKSQ